MKGFIQSNGFMSLGKGFQQGKGFLHPVRGFQLGANLNLLPDEVLVVKQILKNVFYSENTTALGFVIPNVTDNAIWITTQTLYNAAYAAQSGTVEQKTYAGVKAAAMCCDYANTQSNTSVYGKLYNWAAIKLIQMDFDYSVGIKYRCSNYFDWTALTYNLGGDLIAGGHLKETGTTRWNAPNTGADDSIGMKIGGAGQRATTGVFGSQKVVARLAFIDQTDVNNFRWAFLSYNDSKIVFATATKLYGFSLTLIKKSKKLITIGDSITYQSLYHTAIIAKKGYECSIEEIQIGVFGHKAMGVSSSRVIPLINNSIVGQQVGNSIYERADDIKYYNANTILLFGSQNDIGAGNTLGSIADAAYTGLAVSSNPPSFYASYKGTIEKILTQNIGKRLICITALYATDATPELRVQYVNAVLECAALYGLQGVDLLNGVPINASNHATYLSDGVHPNQAGGDLIGEYIASQL